MKKLISYLFLALLAGFVFVGCEKSSDTTVPPTPPTNAPAAP